MWYKYLCMLGGLLSLCCCCFGKTIGVTEATETMDWKKDTVWFIHADYDAEYAPSYKLKLEFPPNGAPAGYTHVRLNWGDGTAPVDLELKNLTAQEHLYKDKGLYEMRIELFPDASMTGTPKVFYGKVMNRELTAVFKTVPSPFKKCMEWGGDSVLLVMTSHDNPPGTEYDIILHSRAEGVIYGVDTLAKATWTSEKHDSAWIVFTSPTGIYGCDVSIHMTYKDEVKDIDLETETDPQRVHVFQRPDIKNIFTFSDSLTPEQNKIENFKVCVPGDQNFLQLDKDVLGIYQYKSGGATAKPYYHSLNKNKDFEILYYYSDNPEDPNSWKEVTGKPEYADTTDHIGFYKPGFYKLRITASNQCNYNPKTREFEADTLYTERVKDHSEVRYFQVSEAGQHRIVCLQDTLCWNHSNQIILVDRNMRKYYDDVPEYEVTVGGYDDVTGYYEEPISKETIFYKDGKVQLPGNIDMAGSDSTRIIITLLGGKGGLKTINFIRRSVCGEIRKDFDVLVGNLPEVPRDTLYKTLLNSYEFYRDKDVYHRCGPFTYDLHWDIWTKNGLSLDSNFVYFGKGSVTDTAEFSTRFRKQFVFDSTGNRPNYIRIKAHNYCGWSKEEEAVFFTRTKPSIALLRDSIPLNDSLCIGFDYPYYLGGVVPENYQVMANFSETTWVDDVEFGAGAEKPIPDWQKRPPLVRHPEGGTVKERLIITNSDMPTCSQVYDTVVHIIPEPDTLIYKDSLRYCDGLQTLDTRKLFGATPHTPRFRWQWNDGAAKKDLSTEFTFSGWPKEDILTYRLSESKGCFREGKLKIKPQPAPELELQSRYPLCLPDTVKDLKTAGYVIKPNPWKPGFECAVYREKIDEFHEELLNKMFIPWEGLDGKALIYDVRNPNVDTAFAAGCHLRDSVIMEISTPKLEINKTDRLTYPWTSYNFKHLEADHFIETEAIEVTTIHWKHIGSGQEVPGTGLYDRSYTLEVSEKSKDSLLFELSANSFCGKTLRDTLVVVLAQAKTEAYQDTICSNTENYPLWNKIKSSNIDETTVKWEICYPAGEKGLSGQGVQAVYTPTGKHDSVRIRISAALKDVPTVQTSDTVVLKINPQPKLKFLTDTLWACGRQIDLTQIDPSKIDSAHCAGLIPGEYIAGTNGGWSGNSFRFSEDIRNYAENITRTVNIKAKGLPGCESVSQKMVLVDPVYATVTFKREIEDLCAGDVLKLDTLYILEGKDSHIHFKWTLETTDVGKFNADTTYYEASQPEDHIQKLKLRTSKSYTCYTGKPSGEILQTSDEELKVTVHREPEFLVKHKLDTLCSGQEEIQIRRDWVSVKPSLYPDYRDSLRVNGRVFTEDIIHKVAAAGLQDTLLVTVAQGRCTKWLDRVDTIFLYRLPSLISGDFTVGDAGEVCEGTEVPLHTDQLKIHPMAKDEEWKAVGGRLTGKNPLLFAPDPGVDQSTITVQVGSPRPGCPQESLSRTIVIEHKPELQTLEYTVCRQTGTVVPVSSEVKPGGKVQKVEWSREDDPAGTILKTVNASTDIWNYVLTEQDSLQGELWLKAKVFAAGACQGDEIFKVHILLQDMPVVSITENLTVCQGAEIDLSPEITVSGVDGPYQLELESTSAGSLEQSVYAPGEYWGKPQFILRAAGLHGCPAVEKKFQLEVKYAAKPQMQISAIHCQQDTIDFSATAGNGVSPEFIWTFGDNTGWEEGESVSHLYQQSDTYTIGLEAVYGTCRRTVEETLTVDPKPQADFNLEPQYPIGQPIHLHSLSLPEGVDCKWDFEDGSSYTGTDCSHIFTGDTGDRKVTLWVTTDKQCRDSLSRHTIAVQPPRAKFEVKVDSCQGLVKITNLSERNHAEVSWDFGNGTSESDVWDPADQVYPCVYQDTVYTISLTLKNSAGTDTYRLPVKMISKLQAEVEVMGTSDVCNKLDKEVHILTKGRADTTEIWWGDGKKEKWHSDPAIRLRSHRYQNDTTVVLNYQVVMAVQNACHRDTTLPVNVPVQPVTVKAKVILDTNYRNACFGVDRGFENKSFGFASQEYNCEWQFEEGADIVTDNAAKVSWLFEKPGTYMVKLRVRDNCNEDLDSVKVIVRGNDSLDFEFGTAPWCTGTDIPFQFVQKGKEVFGDFRWEFPEQVKRKGSRIIYSFATPGEKWVKLSAKADGCKTSVQHRLELNRTPEALVYPMEEDTLKICSRVPIDFKGRNGNDEPCTVLWDFKDRTFSDQENIVKEFQQSGIYPVTFTLTTLAGCRDSVVSPIKVLETPSIPEMQLQKHLFCTVEGDFKLTAFNLSPDKGNCAFEWYQDNKLVSILPDSVDFVYSSFFGKSGLKLKAIHKHTHCAAEQSDTLLSAHAVKAALDILPDKAEACDGEPFTFIDRSDFGDFVTWDLGDGTLAQEEHFEYTYGQAGVYTVGLKVGNQEGCTDSLQREVRVHTLPEADFSWEKDNAVYDLPGHAGKLPDIDNGGIRFTNHSYYVPGAGETEKLSYVWHFGDETATSYDRDPVHVYPNNGTYEAWLYVTNENGCRDSISDFIAISTVKGLYLPNAFAPATSDEGMNRFQPKGVGLYHFEIKVCDFRGNCVWSSELLENGRPAEYWDGNFNGQPAPKGVYNWEVSAVFIDGTSWNRVNGSVILIR